MYQRPIDGKLNLFENYKYWIRILETIKLVQRKNKTKQNKTKKTPPAQKKTTTKNKQTNKTIISSEQLL